MTDKEDNKLISEMPTGQLRHDIINEEYLKYISLTKKL